MSQHMARAPPQHRAADKRANTQACNVIILTTTCVTSCLESQNLSAHGHSNLLNETASDTDGGSNPCGQKPMDFEPIPLAKTFIDLVAQ